MRQEAVTYAGATHGGESAVHNPVQNALGVLDADGKSLTFHGLGGGRALRVEAVVTGVDYGPPAWEAVAEETYEAKLAARAALDGGACVSCGAL